MKIPFSRGAVLVGLVLLIVAALSTTSLLIPRARADRAAAPAANDNRNGTLTAPAGEGSALVTWFGTVPGPRTGAQIVCDDLLNAWFYTLTLTIPDGYYTNHHSKLGSVPVTGESCIRRLP